MALSDYTLSTFDFQIRHITALVAICALIGNYIWTCRFEFTYIWKRPINTYQVAFVISRYVEIIGKMVHYCLIHLILGHSLHGVNPHLCAIWHTFLYAQCAIMVTALDIILALRAYALYQQKSIILLLAPPIATPLILALYDMSYRSRNSAHVFDSSCNVYFHGQAKNNGIAIGISFIAAHGLLWLCVYRKRNIGCGHVPVVRLVVNEGGWIFVILLGIVTASIPVKIAFDAINPSILFVVPSTLISILTCHIIRSMHNLATDAASNTRANALYDDDDTFRLTTIIPDDFDIEMDSCTA
ncbi:hypothetical protein BJ165DRAFT_743833 [Panaeolus papilionaceus]|nr:hypothetical protein BJ165DRAFT_743833 [Panaeolus papilionaceus]